MATDRDQRIDSPASLRATRCQLLLAMLFLVVTSMLGWLLVAYFLK